MKKKQQLTTALLVAPALVLPVSAATATTDTAVDLGQSSMIAPASKATDQATPTVASSPVASAEPTAEATEATPTAEASAEPTVTAAPVESPSLSPSPTTASPSESPTPEPEETPTEPAPTPSPEETPEQPTPTPTPEAPDNPDNPDEPDEPTPTPEPTEPENPEEPTPTPTPEEPDPKEPQPSFDAEEQTIVVGETYDFQVTGVPTPESEVQFTLTNSANVVIELRDSDGELKGYVIRTADKNGHVTLTLNTAGLAPGEYVLTAKTSEGTEITTKVIIAPTPIPEPTEPENPEEPVNPLPPEQPTEPEQPVDPITPEQPVDPTPPVQPVDPVQPTYPEEPALPDVPETPVLPPLVPNQPETPSIPYNPADPNIEALPITTPDPAPATGVQEEAVEPANVVVALREATRIPENLANSADAPERPTSSLEFDSNNLEAQVPQARENSGSTQSREFSSNLQAGAAPSREAVAKDLQTGQNQGVAPSRTAEASASAEATDQPEQADEASSNSNLVAPFLSVAILALLGGASWFILAKRRKNKDEEEA